MDKSFFMNNRQRLFNEMPEGSMAILFAGEAHRKSADMYHQFFSDRNYLYLAGVDYEGFILVLTKTASSIQERLYILPKDQFKERWNGYRYSTDEVRGLSGVENLRYVDSFEDDIFRTINSGQIKELWLDLFKNRHTEPHDISHTFANKVRCSYPWLTIANMLPALRKLRTIKAPCEIEALKHSEEITKDGIIAMMKAAKPGMYEYELKAEFDRVVTKSGVVATISAPIISAGSNNFFIHYNSFTGQIGGDDMILVDVGADWNHLVTDVSRAWPVSGKFTDKQAALYNAAYDTSNYMFEIIKPGMPMKAVDETIRKVCTDELMKIGLLKNPAESSKYIWHGGAHHIGWDVHDMVDTAIGDIKPGMVFCVDVGIYCEEWGIGFRLEDNCLITDTGCVNLSGDIPRSIEEIEAVLAK
ncbi:MAG: Xaa-Pro aminopeptidase [Defluviitaleaceae bacterium]|nr:Xaa-Pro aminopeptidase [Defluviitaleaceae bacterium]